MVISITRKLRGNDATRKFKSNLPTFDGSVAHKFAQERLRTRIAEIGLELDGLGRISGVRLNVRQRGGSHDTGGKLEAGRLRRESDGATGVRTSCWRPRGCAFRSVGISDTAATAPASTERRWHVRAGTFTRPRSSAASSSWPSTRGSIWNAPALPVSRSPAPSTHPFRRELDDARCSACAASAAAPS